MNSDNTIALRDGRMLGYAEYGDRAGRPLLVFHGFPGTRHQALVLNEPAEQLGLRIIGIDRPGCGLSDFLPGRRILDWPSDVSELADALDLDRFAVMGISGGGPYAAACARFIPERLVHTAIVCGMGPLDIPNPTRGMSRQNRLLFWVSGMAPALVGFVMTPMLRRMSENPARYIEQMKASLPEPDRAALERPEVLDMLANGSAEQNPEQRRAISLEASLYARPWGFRLQDIDAPVHLYQGEEDRNVAPGMGHYMADAMPHCIARFYPDEGHLSLLVNCREEFLRAVP
jgi:pimeloyl-ACP methyl ester carboxylesterase